MDGSSASVVSISAAAAACLLLAANRKKESRRRKRSAWETERKRRREDDKNVQTFRNEVKLCDIKSFKHYLRMDETCFNLLLNAIGSQITKQNTVMRKCIPAAEKLAATLRFLSRGEKFTELDESTSLSASFLQRNVIDICEVIYDTLKDEYLKFPTTIAEWENIAKEYESRWHFPLCLGALGGMQIAFTPAKNDAVYFYNDMEIPTIVLLALADSHGNFTFIDVGFSGSISNDEILNRSELNIILSQREDFLPPNNVIGINRCLPYVIVADNTFKLTENIMVPYPTTATGSEEVFNKRLSKARQIVDRSFKILSDRFGILQTRIILRQEKTVKIVKCCCVLHNFLMRHSSWYNEDLMTYTSSDSTESEPTDPSSTPEDHRYERNRKTFMDYFCNEGKIDTI